jgi:hypothetical protein
MLQEYSASAVVSCPFSADPLGSDGKRRDAIHAGLLVEAERTGRVVNVDVQRCVPSPSRSQGGEAVHEQCLAEPSSAPVRTDAKNFVPL